jgi:hypothetical protein
MTSRQHHEYVDRAVPLGTRWDLRGIIDYHDLHLVGTALQRTHADGCRFGDLDDAVHTVRLASTINDSDDQLLLRLRGGDYDPRT